MSSQQNIKYKPHQYPLKSNTLQVRECMSTLNWLKLAGSTTMGITVYFYYKDVIGLSPLTSLFSLPFVYKQSQKYQGIVNSMALPQLLLGTIPSLIYVLYRLNIIPNKTNNIITKQSNEYLYYYCLYSTFMWSTSALFNILNIYSWYIKGNQKVFRTQKTVKKLQEMRLLNENISQQQWLYRDGQRLDYNIDKYGFVKQSFEERTILTPIISEEQVNDWRYRAFLIPHEPIRHALNTLIAITDTLNNCNVDQLKNKIQTFYKWYNDYFYFYIHHHHDAEELIYFPWLSEKCNGEIPKKISKDHVQLLKMLNDIKSFENNFTDIWMNGESKEQEIELKSRVKELNTLCNTLSDDMLEHLNEEETIVPELYKKYDIKEEQEAVVIDQMIQELGLRGNKIMLPWIFEIMGMWGGEKMVDELKAKIPNPILFINYMFWTNDYENNHKQLIKDIMSE